MGEAEYGLCVAYCDALDCDSTDGSEPEKACKKLIYNYLERTENLPPCFIAVHASPITQEIIEVVLEYGTRIQGWSVHDDHDYYRVGVMDDNDVLIIDAIYSYSKQTGTINIYRIDTDPIVVPLYGEDDANTIKELVNALSFDE